MESQENVAVEIEVAEFQLTELEGRLEMAAVNLAYCCECVGQPMCEPL